MRALEAWVLAYLLNSLWQVPVIFVAAWLAARATRRSGVLTEHRIWVSALVLEALLPACSVQPVTLFRETRSTPAPSLGNECSEGRSEGYGGAG